MSALGKNVALRGDYTRLHSVAMLELLVGDLDMHGHITEGASLRFTTELFVSLVYPALPAMTASF